MTRELATTGVIEPTVCGEYQLAKSKDYGGGFITYYTNRTFGFTEMVAKLVTAFGTDILKGSGDGKTSVDLCLDLLDEDGGKICAFMLYDYKEDFQLHIGGGRDATQHKYEIEEALADFFMSTPPTAYTNTTNYGGRILYGWQPPEQLK